MGKFPTSALFSSKSPLLALPSDLESCLETYEIQESTERKRYTWKGPYKQDRQIDDPKENHQRLGGERKAECWSQTGRDRRLKV